MTPAAALLDRLLDIVVTTGLDQPGRISLASGWQCSLSRSASCLPPSGMTVMGAPLWTLRIARDGWNGLAALSCDD